MVSRYKICGKNQAVRLDGARLISSIGFIFKISYSSNGKPVPRGPENAMRTTRRKIDWSENTHCTTEVSASFCTDNTASNGIGDGNQAGKSVWTTCVLKAGVSNLNDCFFALLRSTKARLQTNNKFIAATIRNPHVVGWA